MKNNIERYKIIKPNFEKVKFNDAITFSLVYDDKILKVKPYLLSTKGKITRQSSREKFSLNKEIYFIEKLKTR
jgi:hypothetical protein